jgi:putative oxidoreductase
METLQRYIPLIGRIFLSMIFIASGLMKIGNWDQTAGFMASKGMPMVPVFLAGTIAFQVVGGLCVLLGYRARLGALMLIIFIVPATIIFHNPAGLEGMAQQTEMGNMMKNISILGGLMLVLGLGAGPLSLDNRRAS